jgi:Gpi18-like mannosyltransferase
MTAPLAAPLTPSALPWPARLSAAWQRHRGWLWREVVAVFLLTRLALVGLALLAQQFPLNPLYPDASVVARGWSFTPLLILDVWARWDSGWYFDIIQHGYYANGAISTVQSNLGFFPLYPLLVSGLTALLPPALHSWGAIILMGVLVSNILLLGGLVLLRQWVLGLTGDPAVARRTVLYLLLFPTGFFFSAFYTESTFLCFAAAALYAAQRRAWFWAALAGALLTLSRPLGILISVPLAWQYAAAAGWHVRRLRWNVLWFALLPLAFLAFCGWLYLRTGDFLATVHTRVAWSRGFAWPWQTLLDPNELYPYITPLEQGLTVLFLVGAVLALWRLPSLGLGLWALLLLAPPLFTHQLTSTSRYDVTVLPVFVVLAQLRRPTLHALLLTASAVGQAVLFVMWCRLYWVA